MQMYGEKRIHMAGEGVRADVCGKVNKMGECGASGRMYVEK